MEALTVISARNAFELSARLSPEEERRLREELRRKAAEAEYQSQTRRDDRKEKEEARQEQEELAVLIEMAIASPAEIAEFNVKLDRHEERTIEALLTNERETKELTDRIENTLANATRLPDGRRVFKSLDGSKVFDEFGVEVSARVIQPDQIDSSKERFEPYWNDQLDRKALSVERERLGDVMHKIDEAREEAGKDGVKSKRLKELDSAIAADIEAATPERLHTRRGLTVDPDKAFVQQSDNDLDRLDIPAQTVASARPNGP